MTLWTASPLGFAGSRGWLALLPALFLAVLVGCSDKDKVTVPEPDPSPYAAPTSPHALLDNLITAMELRDIDAYRALFDETEFTFVFDPRDVTEQPDLPPFWGYATEVLWAGRAFASLDVLDIRLAYIKGVVADADSTDGDVPETWKKVTITGIELEVEVRNPDDPTDNIIYPVSGDRGLFFFAEIPGVVIDGQATWKITEWRDIRVGARPDAPAVAGSSFATLTSSFGAVKAVFR